MKADVERADVLKPKEAAAYLTISVRKLRQLGLPRHKLGHRTIRYDRAVLDRYLQQTRDAA